MKIFPHTGGGSRADDLFEDRRRNDAGSLLFPVAVLAGLFTTLAYLAW